MNFFVLSLQVWLIKIITKSSSNSAIIKIRTLYTCPVRELEQHIVVDSFQVPSQADLIYSQACQRQTNRGNINIPLNVSIKILSKFPLLNYLVQPHTLNLNVKTEEVNRCRMIIQLRYILDIPHHTLLPKMGVFLACIDALQHLRKEIVLVWERPPQFLRSKQNNTWDPVLKN